MSTNLYGAYLTALCVHGIALYFLFIYFIYFSKFQFSVTSSVLVKNPLRRKILFDLLPELPSTYIKANLALLMFVVEVFPLFVS